LAEALGSSFFNLSKDDLALFEQVVPEGSATGDRCPAQQMAHLDSKR
jgi:hypothetical protein